MNSNLTTGSDKPAVPLKRDRSWSLADAIRDTSYCRPIRGHDRYYITIDGAVISAKRKRLRVLAHVRIGSGEGYWAVGLWDGSRQSMRYIHALILEHFGPPRPSPAHVASHCDGNRDNNALTNLTWALQKEVGERRMRRGGYSFVCGEAHPGHKLTESDVLTIHRRAHAGEDQKTIAAAFNVVHTLVSAIKLGQRWKHVIAKEAA